MREIFSSSRNCLSLFQCDIRQRESAAETANYEEKFMGFYIKINGWSDHSQKNAPLRFAKVFRELSSLGHSQTQGPRELYTFLFLQLCRINLWPSIDLWELLCVENN